MFSTAFGRELGATVQGAGQGPGPGGPGPGQGLGQGVPGGHGWSGEGFGQGGPGLGGRGQFGPGLGGHGVMGGPAGPIMALIAIALLVGLVIAFWQIFKKAGYPGAYGLLIAIPFVNIAVLVFLAASEWPIHKELAGWRAWHRAQEQPAADPDGVVSPAEGVQFADARQWDSTAPIAADAPLSPSDDTDALDQASEPPKK
jgi:hypothetical protein